MSSAILPPLFQILTGLSFAAILVIRFLAPASLKPTWGKLMAFSVVLVALGNVVMSFATAKGTLSSGAELFAFAGASYFAAALLVVVGLVLATRSANGAVRP